MSCFFKPFVETACDGPTDRCHLLPKGFLKREVGKDPEIIWDERVWVPGCRRHHADFDNFVFRIPREALPSALEAFAVEHGVLWRVDRDYRSVAA